MKKLTLILISIIYSIACMGQQIALSDAVNISLPARAEKLNKEQMSSFAAKRFNNDEMALKAIALAKTPHLYKVDDMLISFNTATGNTEENHLLKLKNGLAEMSKKDKSYTSSIKTVNNHQILVISYISGNVNYYDFYCFNSINSSAVTAITGSLQYDKANADKATALLDTILNSIKFTK